MQKNDRQDWEAVSVNRRRNLGLRKKKMREKGGEKGRYIPRQAARQW